MVITSQPSLRQSCDQPQQTRHIATAASSSKANKPSSADCLLPKASEFKTTNIAIRTVLMHFNHNVANIRRYSRTSVQPVGDSNNLNSNNNCISSNSCSISSISSRGSGVLYISSVMYAVIFLIVLMSSTQCVAGWRLTEDGEALDKEVSRNTRLLTGEENKHLEPSLSRDTALLNRLLSLNIHSRITDADDKDVDDSIRLLESLLSLTDDRSTPVPEPRSTEPAAPTQKQSVCSPVCSQVCHGLTFYSKCLLSCCLISLPPASSTTTHDAPCSSSAECAQSKAQVDPPRSLLYKRSEEENTLEKSVSPKASVGGVETIRGLVLMEKRRWGNILIPCIKSFCNNYSGNSRISCIKRECSFKRKKWLGK